MSKAATPEPAPQKGEKKVLDYVMQDFIDRAEMGKQKYGTYLETNNGRNALNDLYQELADAVMYIKQELLQRAGTISVKIMTAKDEPEENRQIAFYIQGYCYTGWYLKKSKRFHDMQFNNEIDLSAIDFWFYIPPQNELEKVARSEHERL